MDTDSRFSLVAGAERRSHEVLDRRLASMAHALGPEIADALADPAVTDIHLNADGVLRCVGQGFACRILGDLSPQRAESVIRLLASHMGTEVTAERPTVSGVLPGTIARFQGVVPPVSAKPIFAIRKHSEVIFTLDDLVNDGVLSQTGVDMVRRAIMARVNVLIVGGTGSGKTTIANACLAEPAFCQDRVVLIEDTRELQCAAADRIELIAAPLLQDISMDELVRTTLRLFPGRIVIGEVRGPEALSMIKAWGTGHPGGLCTIHANGPRDALYRLEDLIGEVAVTIPRRTIAQTIGLIVFVERGHDNKAGRKVTGMTRPRLGDDGEYAFDDIEL